MKPELVDINLGSSDQKNDDVKQEYEDQEPNREELQVEDDIIEEDFSPISEDLADIDIVEMIDNDDEVYDITSTEMIPFKKRECVKEWIPYCETLSMIATGPNIKLTTEEALFINKVKHYFQRIGIFCPIKNYWSELLKS